MSQVKMATSRVLMKVEHVVRLLPGAVAEIQGPALVLLGLLARQDPSGAQPRDEALEACLALSTVSPGGQAHVCLRVQGTSGKVAEIIQDFF